MPSSLLHARNEDGSSRYLREPQIRALETRNTGRIGYRMVLTATDTVARPDVGAVREFVSGTADSA